MTWVSHCPATPSLHSCTRGGMAEVLGILARPGLLAGAVLVLVLGSNPVLGANATTTKAPARNVTGGNEDQELDILHIVLPIVVLGALAIALAVVFWLLCVVKKKRQTEGTYRPSAEEQSGSHGVEMPDALKLPKEERLI
ncbi:unnamed protein product [Arctogadus glacialis]